MAKNLPKPAGDRDQSLVREDPTFLRAPKPEHRTAEPVLWSLGIKRNQPHEKPMHRCQRVEPPHWPQPEEALRGTEDPAQP